MSNTSALEAAVAAAHGPAPKPAPRPATVTATVPVSLPAEGQLVEVLLELVQPDPDNPRESVGDLTELMESMAEHGLIQPLIVRRTGDEQLVIVAGHRRHEAAKRLGSGVYKLGAIRKGAEPDRVRELLRVMNYIAASYGTAEWLDVYYGAEGDDWTWQEADGGLYLPQRTERGNAERNMVFYVSGPLFTVSAPGYPDIAKRAYEFMKTAAETGEALPTAGLYSDTDTSRGATWAKDINALIGDIIQGRKQVSDWDELAKRWKADCGDAIAGEYAEAYAAANGG